MSHKKQIKFVVFICLILALSSCKNTWDEESKDAWRSACLENAHNMFATPKQASTYCDCVLDKIIERYPNLNDALENTATLAADTAFHACKVQAAALK